MSRFREYRHRARLWWDVPPHAATTAFVSLILLTAAGFFWVQHQASVQTAKIRAAQVKVCEDSLSPTGVRGIVAAIQEQQIAQSEAISPKLFPSIPPKQFKKLVAESNEIRREQVDALRGVDCEALYKPK